MVIQTIESSSDYTESEKDVLEIVIGLKIPDCIPTLRSIGADALAKSVADFYRQHSHIQQRSSTTSSQSCASGATSTRHAGSPATSSRRCAPTESSRLSYKRRQSNSSSQLGGSTATSSQPCVSGSKSARHGVSAATISRRCVSAESSRVTFLRRKITTSSQKGGYSTISPQRRGSGKSGLFTR